MLAMHIIEALRSDFYEVELAGKPARRWDVFPGWNERDRFGIVLYEPLAALGAIHLIQLACMCFYDSKPSRRTDRKIYPEIFAIHVGQWQGMHGNLDFWPARREILVPDDHREILAAINDRGITRLALPERHPRNLPHRRKEEDCALDWLTTAVVYSPGGRVASPDFTIRSNSARSEIDVRKIFRPPQITPERSSHIEKAGLRVKEGDADFAPRILELSCNVSAQAIKDGERLREELKENGMIVESYRFLSPELALKWL
jgi:hypothetical protein